MTKKWTIYVLTIGIILGSVLGMFRFSKSAIAENISSVEVYSSVYGNIFEVNAKWIKEDYADIVGKLYHESILITEDDDPDYLGNDEYRLNIHDDSLEDGTYRFQLWSNSEDRELYAKSWEVPKLAITQRVTNQDGNTVTDSDTTAVNGQIGTMFVSTTELAIQEGGPDAYFFGGSLQIHFNEITIDQDITSWMYRDGYYEYFGYDSYEVEPVYVSNIFTFTEGNYNISAEYEDSYIKLKSDDISVKVSDQYQPRMDAVQSDIEDLEDSLSTEIQDLKNTDNGTTATMENNQNELTREIDSVENDANGYTNIVLIISITASVIGILGIVIGLLGMKKGKKSIKKYKKLKKKLKGSVEPKTAVGVGTTERFPTSLEEGGVGRSEVDIPSDTKGAREQRRTDEMSGTRKTPRPPMLHQQMAELPGTTGKKELPPTGTQDRKRPPLMQPK